MAKKEKAVYAPGELSRVREKLGVTDVNEARRIAGLLGGEVGTERDAEMDNASKKSAVSGKRGRKIDIAAPDFELSRYPKTKTSVTFPGDDPAVPAKLGYSERVKIDQYAGQLAFEIKTSLQVLTSVFSFFKEPVDYVSPRFVTVRMNEYYGKIERLVTSARNLFPKNNLKRNNQLKRTSFFIYKMLDILRNWNIEQLAHNIADLQAHPRAVKVTDFAEVLRDIYRPLFILEDISLDDFKTAFKLIYKILYIESPMDAKGKYQDIIRNIITSLSDIRRNVHFGLYPLLMKMISNRFITYERFFIERRRRCMAFLNVTEVEPLNAADLSPQQIENIDMETLQKELSEEPPAEEAGEDGGGQGIKEDPNDPKVAERRAREDAEKADRKARDQGRSVLEALFPKAGWEKLDEYPDLYPYFAGLYTLRHGYELIAPGDPLQQVVVMLYILDDMLIGMRNIIFNSAPGPDGKYINLNDEIGGILDNWRRNIEDSFSRDYLPRLTEYCRMLENTGDVRSNPYIRKSMNELHWIKRLYFLPYFKFDSIGPPPFPKQEIVPVYSEIRKLRRHLTIVAKGIENGMRTGGTGSKAPCDGISNPWNTYNFQVPNIVSRHMDMIMPPERRLNATLVFFTLSTITMLDYIVNNENSWAYNTRHDVLFRSVKDEGLIPLFGADQRLDADKIFKESLKKKDA